MMGVTTMTHAYPAHREVDVALRGGGAIHVRPIRAADEQALRAMLDALSVEARAFRFFSAGADMGLAARASVDVDYADRYGVVAVGGDGSTILAHGMYSRDSDDCAEVAFTVAEGLRGEGIATTMLAHLAEAARAAGIPRFVPHVMPSNHRMLEVFRESGFDATVRSEPDGIAITMPTELSAGAQERYDARAARAAAAAVERVLRPRSVAVVGASARPGSVGGTILRNLIAAGFTGELHVVNPRGGEIEGVPAVASVRDVPGELDLVVIATPAETVVDIARDCVAKGVHALVVISAGFAETGAEGAARQRELLRTCRAGGIRLVGPNCLGVANTDPAVRLNASFGPVPPDGRVAFMSQSGALGIAVVESSREEGVGLSSFVSVGNKSDLSGNDFLAFWDQDEATDVILLYLESFGNPRRFVRVARNVARRKPIIAVKGGRSAAGARAAGSHTGALLQASDSAVDALFSQAGVMRTDTLGELFHVASLLSRSAPPAGPRTAIVTNGGGLGILCADACQAAGLEVVATPADTQHKLMELLPDAAAAGNPVDLLAAASPEQFEQAVGLLAASEAYDSVIVLYVPPLVTEPEAVAAAIKRAADAAPIPVVAAFAMPQAPEAARGMASFQYPEDAARALGRAARYGRWRARPPGRVPQLDVEDGRAAAVISGALARGPGWLLPDEVSELLDCYGIAQPRHAVVPDADGAVALARRWRRPIALKGVAAGLVHRSDAGAVALNLRGAATIANTAAAMNKRMEERGLAPGGFLVQEMAEPGVEMLVGAVVDPTFGPVVAVAAGGTAVELLGDSSVRLGPLTEPDAHDAIRKLRTFPLLDGYRGAPKADVPALERALLAISALTEAHHEVVEVECNPFIVSPRGAVAVDARVRVERAPEQAPEPSLRPG
jgi:acetyl coenzyme A synthetase (ADP forming)-like protein